MVRCAFQKDASDGSGKGSLDLSRLAPLPRAPSTSIGTTELPLASLVPVTGPEAHRERESYRASPKALPFGHIVC